MKPKVTEPYTEVEENLIGMAKAVIGALALIILCQVLHDLLKAGGATARRKNA
jgi:hypothetical protein